MTNKKEKKSFFEVIFSISIDLENFPSDVHETCVSRHNGRLIEGSLEPLDTIVL